MDAAADETLAEVGRRAVPDAGIAAVREPAVAAPHVRIERIIQHQLDNEKPQPLLAEAVSTLPSKTRDLFCSYIEETATRAEWIGSFAEPDGQIARWCDALLKDETTFVDASRQLAGRLFKEMKPRTIAAGDLAVVNYTVDGETERRVALLKLDPQVRQVRTFERIGGYLRVVYDEAYNTMPEDGHLQKCALPRRLPGERGYDIVLLDKQARPTATTDIAQFFYKRFLGAILAPSPRQLTRRFIDLCEAWLAHNGDDLTPADVFAFYAARREVLGAASVNITRFAEAALAGHPSMRTTLIEHIAVGLGSGEPAQRIEQFPVDRVIADGLVRMVRLELDGGAQLRMPADQLASLLDLRRLRRVGNRYELVLTSLILREVST